MFIWRDDNIGRKIAEELLSSADRGVKITIVKDSYATVLEYAEESQKSLFHLTPTLFEKIKIKALRFAYNPTLPKARCSLPASPLYKSLTTHPNITVFADEKRADHSKFYIFDNSVVIMGGINIEDKENGADLKGRVYRDYMVKFCDEDIVNEFIKKQKNPKLSSIFAVNRKHPTRVFEIESRYLSLIEGAERTLTILMGYFAPWKSVLSAIKKVAQKGVDVLIVIPKSANYFDDRNKKAMSKLMDMKNPNIKIYLTDEMLHAKLLISEKEISVGSCNIDFRAFTLLDELNCFIPNDDSAVACDIRASAEDVVNSSHLVKEKSELKHNRLLAKFEDIFS